MSGAVATACWTRLDCRGEDRCALFAEEAGWRLSGEAAFDEGEGPVRLAYAVLCDEAWRTVSASVEGEGPAGPVALSIDRDGTAWRLQGVAQPGLDAATDLDLSFTPATNLLPIRRLGLAVGNTARTTAAWLTPDFLLAPLVQAYERRGPSAYGYTSPAHDFSAELTVHPTGFVLDYPGLWRGEVTA